MQRFLAFLLHVIQCSFSSVQAGHLCGSVVGATGSCRCMGLCDVYEVVSRALGTSCAVSGADVILAGLAEGC
jgi:hypothetical protein